MPETEPRTQPEPETVESWHMRIVRHLPEVPDHSLSSSPLTTALLKDLHARVAVLEHELCQ